LEPSYVRPEGGILFSCVETHDDFVAAYQRDIVFEPDRIETHNMAIMAGYRALAAVKAEGGLLNLTEQLSGSVKAAGDHATGVAKALEERIGGIASRYLADDGVFSKHFDDFAKSVEGQLDPTSPAMQKMRERLQRDVVAFNKTAIDEIKAMMNMADEKSPVGRIQRDVQTAIVAIGGIKAQLDAQSQLHQARQATPLIAGRSLETFVNEVIAPIASIHGEALEDIRDVVSTTAERKKTGDFASTIDGRLTPGRTARIVIEAKNRKSMQTPALLKELSAAMTARQATVGLGVLTYPNAKCRPIVAYENGTKVIISLPGFGDPDVDYLAYASLLELGFEYARLLAVSKAITSPNEAIDLGAVSAKVNEVNKAVERFKTLADNHTRIISAVEAARETASEIRMALTAAVGDLKTTLHAEIERVSMKAIAA